MKYFYALLFSMFMYSAKAFADDNPPPPGPPPPPAPPVRREIVISFTGKKKEEEGQDDDLGDKVRKQREADEKRRQETVGVEGAVQFNLGLPAFMKENKDILPPTAEDIIKQAETEKYDTQVQRSNVIKASLLKEFFGVQANVDLLTPAQKLMVSSFIAMTKTAREEKADNLYATVFEPLVLSMRSQKRAVELHRSRLGYGTPTDSSESYKNRLVKHSRRAHLGEKAEA